MNILFLTNNNNSYELIKWLKNKENKVQIYNNKIEISVIKKLSPDFIISYNYKYIINKKIINFMRNKIINLHISYLPWNRGSNPNLWSLIDNTPIGVTIHLIDENIDTGDIIVQKKVKLNYQQHTLKSSYNLLNKEIQILFKNNWENIIHNKISLIKQKNKGSIHFIKDFEILKKQIRRFNWDMKIIDFLDEYKKSMK